MEIEIFDILLLFILAMTFALIIGINVMYIVDKKLGDVQINVPACPKPSCPRPIYPAHICTRSGPKGSSKTNPKLAITYESQPSESIKSTTHQEALIDSHYTVSTKCKSKDGKCIIDLAKNQKNVESFEDVSKSNEDGNDAQYLETRQTVLPMVITQDNTPTSKKTVLLRQGYNNTGADKPNIGDNITYPSSANVIRYNGPGCYQNIDTVNIKKLKFNEINNTSCRPYTDGSVKEDSYNQIKSGFMTPSSNEPNRIVQQDIRFYVPRVYMGVDPHMSGISYAGMSLENPADIDQIGSIPVNDYNGEPVPISSFMSNDE